MKRLHACGVKCVFTQTLLMLMTVWMVGCSSAGPGAGEPGTEPATPADTSDASDAETPEPDAPVDDEVDASDCGECADNQVCVDGECVCEAGYLDCDGDRIVPDLPLLL